MSTRLAIPGVLVRLQNAVADFLANDVASGARAFFTDASPQIFVQTEQQGSLLDAINKGIAKTGMTVVVKAFTGEKPLSNQPGKIGWEKVPVAVYVGYTPKLANQVHGATIAEKVVWVMRKFIFEGKIPMHEGGPDLMPSRPDKPDQAFYSLVFTFTNLINDKEPMRGEPEMSDEDGAPLTVEDDLP